MSLLDDQLQGAQVLASGTFRLDRRRAMEKLARFQLEDPHRYVLELVAAAVRAGSTAIHVRNDSDDFEIRWDGKAPSAEHLDYLFDHIFSRGEGDTARSLQHLAQGVFGALGLKPRWVHVERPGARYDLTDPLEPTRTGCERTEGVFLHVRERFGWNVVREFMNPLHASQETRLLERDAWTSPVPVVVNGTDITRALPPLTLTDNDSAYVVMVRDGIVVQRETVPLGSMWLTGAIRCDHLDLNASHSKVVRNKPFDQVMAELIRTAVQRVMADELEDEARRQAGLYLLLHHLRHATPLAEEPLFRDAADRLFSLMQLRQAERVYFIDPDAPPDPTWAAPHFRSGTSLQISCLRERLRGMEDGSDVLRDRHAGRVRRGQLAQMASPLAFGDDAFARRSFRHGETEGAVALFTTPGMATIELRVDGLPVQSITTPRLPDGMRCRVGHPGLKADVRFSRVLHEEPFPQVVQHCIDEAQALLLQQAQERPRQMTVRRALLAWLKRCKSPNEVPPGLDQAALWTRGDGTHASLADLRERPQVSRVQPGLLAPECAFVSAEEFKLLRRLNKKLEDHTQRVEDRAVAASRREMSASATLPAYTEHRSTIRLEGLSGQVGLRQEPRCEVLILHQGVPLGTHRLALPNGLSFAVEWSDAQPNTRWDGLENPDQLVDLALRLKEVGHKTLREGAASFHANQPLTTWMISGLEAGLLDDIPLFRQTDGPLHALKDLAETVRVTTVAPSRPWPVMSPLYLVDPARRDALKRCRGAGKVDDLTHRIQERNHQHERFRRRPVQPFTLNGAWGQEPFQAGGLDGIVGICTDQREGLRVAVLAEDRLLTTLATPSRVPAIAIVRGEVEPNAAWDGLQSRDLGDELIRAAAMGLKRLLLEALETRAAPPAAMRRAMVWSSGLDDDLEQLPIVRSLNRGTLSVKALREAEQVWSVPPQTEANPNLNPHGVWVRADVGVKELLYAYVPRHANGTRQLKELEEGWARRRALGTEPLHATGDFIATWRLQRGPSVVWGGVRERGEPRLQWLVEQRVIRDTPLRTNLFLTLRATDDELEADAAFQQVAPGAPQERTTGLIDEMRERFPLELARALTDQPTDLIIKDRDGVRRALIRWLGQQPKRMAEGFEDQPLVKTADGRWLDAPGLAAVARQGEIRVVSPQKTGRTLEPERPAIPADVELRTALHAYRGTVPYDDELDRDEETLRRRESPAQQPTPSASAFRVRDLPEPWEGFAELHPDGNSSVQLHVGWRFVESRRCPGPVPLVVYVTGEFTPDERWRSIQDDEALQMALTTVQKLSDVLLAELLRDDPDGRQWPGLWHRILPRVFKHRRDVRQAKGMNGQLARLPLFVTGSGNRLSAIELMKLRKPVWVPRDLAVPARKKDRPFIVLPPQGMKSTIAFWGGIDGTEAAKARQEALVRRQGVRRPWQLPDVRWLAEGEHQDRDWKVLAAIHPNLEHESRLDVRINGVPVDTWRERRWPGLVGVVEVPEGQVREDFRSARRSRKQDQALDALYADLVQRSGPEVQKSLILQRSLAQLLPKLSNSSKARRAWMSAPLLPGSTLYSLAEARDGDVVFSATPIPDCICLVDNPGTRRLLAVLGISHRTRKEALQRRNAERETRIRKQETLARREEEARRQRALERNLPLLSRGLRDAGALCEAAMKRRSHAGEDQQTDWQRAWHRLDAVLVAKNRWADAAEVAVRSAERILEPAE